ncbi:hypothetical protein [Acaryochloris thomasi]|nr:hypothetical protein [Acaryochloris thomasi]
MSPIYRSEVPRCWEVTHLELPSQHFFAFALRSKRDQVLIYGVISASPKKRVVLSREEIEFDADTTEVGQKRPLPRSLCRLILTGKPLIESVVTLLAKREKLKAQQDLSSSSGMDSADLTHDLQQELWFTDKYLERLYDAIAHLYHQVVNESQLIKFDSSAVSDIQLQEADLRAEHVERMLDTLEKEKGKRKKWALPKMFNRSLQ